MNSTGWLFPTSATTLARGGSTGSWANGSNILADDTSYASWGQFAFGTIVSPYLVAKGFAVSSHVPPNARIQGVEVDISRWQAQTADDVFDSLLQLYLSGAVIGSDKHDTLEWATSQETISYGANNDLWGASLTPAIVRHADFGVALSVAGDGWDTPACYVDFVRMRVSWLPNALLEIC